MSAIEYQKNYKKNNSHSSIKLPRIQRSYLYQNNAHNHKNSININTNTTTTTNNDISSKLINIKTKKSLTKLDNNNNNNIKQKLIGIGITRSKTKSRVQGNRIKTENIGDTTNNSIVTQQLEVDQFDNTLKDFKKNIRENRLQMQIQNNNNNFNKKIIKSKASLKSLGDIQQNCIKSNKYLKKDNKSIQSDIFQNIKKILNKNNDRSKNNNNNKDCQLPLQQVQKAVRITNLVKKIQKFYPQNQRNIKQDLMKQIKVNQQGQKIQFKNQDNYTQWRRVSLSPNSTKPQYQKSTYQNQNQRLNNLILQTQATISKYIQNKKVCQQLKQKLISNNNSNSNNNNNTNL